MEEALGMIESRGLVGAIEAADAMVKSANVKFLGRKKVKGGLMIVMVSGEVGAVKAAVDAGRQACKEVGHLVSAHVIPRPAEGIETLLPKPETPAPMKRKRRQAKREKPKKKK